jgi:hypothetical protein
VRIKAACHNFRVQISNEQQQKTLNGSERWLQSSEVLEFAARDELKKIISLSYKDASRVTAAGGASAVPAGEGSSPLLSGGSGISLPAL